MPDKTQEVVMRTAPARLDPIITNNIYPPIPIRQFDWVAYRDPEGWCGYGATEAEAIADLLALEDA